MMHSENGRWVALGVFVVFFIFGGQFLFSFADLNISGISGLFWAIAFPNVNA